MVEYQCKNIMFAVAFFLLIIIFDIVTLSLINFN